MPRWTRGALDGLKPACQEAEGPLKRAIQHRHAHGEEGLSGVAIPSHLLSLDHSLGDHCVDR